MERKYLFLIILCVYITLGEPGCPRKCTCVSRQLICRGSVDLYYMRFPKQVPFRQMDMRYTFFSHTPKLRTWSKLVSVESIDFTNVVGNRETLCSFISVLKGKLPNTDILSDCDSENSPMTTIDPMEQIPENPSMTIDPISNVTSTPDIETWFPEIKEKNHQEESPPKIKIKISKNGDNIIEVWEVGLVSMGSTVLIVLIITFSILISKSSDRPICVRRNRIGDENRQNSGSGSSHIDPTTLANPNFFVRDMDDQIEETIPKKGYSIKNSRTKTDSKHKRYIAYYFFSLWAFSATLCTDFAQTYL